MASGVSGQANSGSIAYDFASDDILCSYNDLNNHESSNNSDPGSGANSVKMVMELGSTSTHEVKRLDFGQQGKRINQVLVYKVNVTKEEDRISEIPDVILTSILSLLTLKEAARSSVLSRRWEKLWIFYTGCLNFDASESLSFPKNYRIKCIKEFDAPRRLKYVNWVNQVLASLDESLPSFSKVDGFRVCFDLPNGHYNSHIDKWIEFILDKRVGSLELDFGGALSYLGPDLQYTFPLEIFNNHVKRPRCLYNLSALTSLSLKSVAVSGYVIEYFLSNSPFLERLCVKDSKLLINLKVTSAALMLKYVEIFVCTNVESVEIHAPNIISFHYDGPKMKLNVENAPHLVKVFIGDLKLHNVMCMFHSLSRYFSQLETLKLRMYAPKGTRHSQLGHLDQFTKLKHLNLYLFFPSELLRWTVLIDASPILQKLTVEVQGAHNGKNPPKWTKRLEVRKSPHEGLRVVEFVGFVGGKYDVDLIMHLFANAHKLEKLIINCSGPLSIGKPCESVGLEMQRKDAEERALELKSSLPSQVELVII